MASATLDFNLVPGSVAFITMGCAKNEVDTNHMKELVSQAGYQVIEDPAMAAAVVINTCTFIQSATEESLSTIFEAADLENVASGTTKLIVAGCMPSRYGSDLSDELTEATAFLPCAQEDTIVSVLEGLIGAASCAGAELVEQAVSHAPSQYVKISDGCNRFCSYCAIPYIRGRYHSFSYESIQADVEKALQRGAREIVLIAQDTGRWGDDFREPLSLAWLMEHLAQSYPETWFRVMYVQPEGITDEVLRVMAQYPNICSYIDMPLQHVDESLLHSMNRSGSLPEFVQLIQHIKQMVPDVTLRTTLIAGFPGETPDQFDQLCDFVSEGYFDYVGVFAYSAEEGTRAAKLPEQIDEDEKNSRAQTLRDIADAVCAQLVSERCDSVAQVLVEGVEEDGQIFGRAQCQAPEVDGVTYIPQGEVGSFVTVRITDTLLYEMEGELFDE